jgi:predicted GIY-YIG superfamily endonuclease
MEDVDICSEQPDGWRYVYRIESKRCPSFSYTGATSNLHHRLQQHNRRENLSTAPYVPFRLAFTAAFPSKHRALAFESYLKSGSGLAFARKRLW